MTRLLVAFVLVLLTTLISDLRSDHPAFAFLGSFERMEGFIALAHLFALFLVARAVLSTERRRRAWLGALVLGSMAVAAMGGLQLAMFVAAGAGRVQVSSTLGNPSFLGQYAVLMAFLAAFLACRGRWAWIWRLAAAVNIAVACVAQSRGAILALLAGAAVAALTLASRRTQAAVLVAVVALGIGAWALPEGAERVPVLERFRELSLSDVRLPAWEAALKAARDRPFFGWGQEGFREAHDRYCVANCHMFDRAHNLVVDWLITGGLFGLYAWGMLLLAARRAVAEGFAGAERAALYGFLVAYVVSDMTLFDTITSYLPLVAALAVAEARAIAARWPPR